MKPQQIEKDSFRIIDELADYSSAVANKYYSDDDHAIVRRMIHASGDTQIAESIRISQNARNAGITALSNNTEIVCDVNMVKSGLTGLMKTGINIHCFVNHESVVTESKNTGETRARRAMLHAAKYYPEAIYIIGNAPTALLALLELHNAAEINPALVIGIPVGFVMAKESKDMLMNSNVHYITNLGYKGGSPMAVAAMNALSLLHKSKI